MQKTANYGLNKPDGTDTVDISVLNGNMDTIDVKLKNNSDDTEALGEKVSSHLADMTSQANGKGASMIGVEDSAGHFTGTNVEAVLNELFTSASSGKSAIATAAGSPSTSSETFSQLATDITNGKNNIYNAITAKGAIPTSKTFADLVSSIGNISTGKKSANGTLTVDSSGVVSVNSLDFTPTLIILGHRQNVSYAVSALYWDGVLSDASYVCMYVTMPNGENYTRAITVNSTGFSVTMPYYDNTNKMQGTYYWMAIE